MISVIIPHLDQPRALRRCLQSLSSQESVTGSVECIVVDNGSPEPPVELCGEFHAKLLVQPTPGPGPARNLGVSQAGGKILAFIDADCTAAPTWLSEIQRSFNEHPEATILGGDVRIACVDPRHPTWLEAYESVFAYRMKEYIKKQGFTGTGNLAVRAETFAAVGPFGGIGIAEDRDWGQRALRLGHRTRYCPTMVVYHPARRSFAEIALKWQRHIAHDFEAIRKKPGWRLLWLARTAAVALSPAFELPRIGLSKRLQGLRSRALAFAGVVAIRAYRAWVMTSIALGTSAPGMAAKWNRA